MTQTSPAVKGATRPRTSTLDRPTLMRLAAAEYDRFITLLRSLHAEDWPRATECPGWDVRAMVSHTLGMAEMAATIREGRRQQKAANKRGGVFLDALTALQVEERAGLTERYAVIGPRAAAPGAVPPASSAVTPCPSRRPSATSPKAGPSAT
jgi:uncharacterized protein (TIGR03083 family)